MDPFRCLAAQYRDNGAVVHWGDSGFIVAVAKAFGRTLYRVHRDGDFAGLPGLVPGKAAALAALSAI